MSHQTNELVEEVEKIISESYSDLTGVLDCVYGRQRIINLLAQELTAHDQALSVEIEKLKKGPFYFTPDATENEKLAGDVGYNYAINNVLALLKGDHESS